MKPQILIGIQPAPLEEVMKNAFHEESKKLMALYTTAPELFKALEQLIHRCKKQGLGVGYDDDVLAAERVILKAKGY